MKNTLLFIIGVIAFASILATAKPAPEFFVFDNGVGRGSWTPERQAKTIKELGFNGISYNYTNPKDLALWQAAFKKQNLKIYAIYLYTFIDQEQPFDPSFKEAVKLLKGTDTVVWMTVRAPKVKGGFDDDKAVKVVQEVADLAAAQGVRVALYGHFGFYVADAVDSARFVKLANRPNLGATINLCHEFYTGHGRQLDETLKAVAPVATMASINGIDVANTNYLLRLDQGDFDVTTYLKKLLVAGYQGPVGLQCYSVKGDLDENLKADMAAWKKISAGVAQNTLTPKEASAGWRLLFDGCTTTGWRRYQQPVFPDHGWCIEDGCLKSLAQKGGDIMTTMVFTNFELAWEWRIAPGGNSGVKYFINESRPNIGKDPTNPDPCIAHEYQMIDDDNYPEEHLTEKQKTAAWYAVLAPKNARPKPVGEFNQSRLIVRGNQVEHWLNGKRVLTYKTDSAGSAAAVADSKFKYVSGYLDKIPTGILFQDHNTIAWMRNIKIRDLP